MKKRTLALVFFVPWVLLAGWVVGLACLRAGGSEVTVSITGYDPRDLLSGRYIAYQIDWEQTDCTQFPGKKCPPGKEFCTDDTWGRSCRFYISETSADGLDRLFRQRNESLRFEVVYSYAPHKKPIAKKLLINGQNWQDYLRQNPGLVKGK